MTLTRLTFKDVPGLDMAGIKLSASLLRLNKDGGSWSLPSNQGQWSKKTSAHPHPAPNRLLLPFNSMWISLKPLCLCILVAPKIVWRRQDNNNIIGCEAQLGIVRRQNDIQIFVHQIRTCREATAQTTAPPWKCTWINLVWLACVWWAFFS